MATTHPEHLLFHLTGKRQDAELEPIDTLGLRPALMAGFRDLNRLRYDFPLVLVEGVTGDGCVRSLSSVVDDVLRVMAPRGIDGERLRRHALQLEREIRRMVAEGTSGRLSELWEAAAHQVGAREGETHEQVLALTGSKLGLDGLLVDCDHAMPEKMFRHLWQANQQRKAQKFSAVVNRLVIKLSDILRAAYVHSEEGRRPASLKATVGGPYRDVFDFDAMSRLIGKGQPADELPHARRERIQWALRVLQSQRFYTHDASDTNAANAPFQFVFHDCESAKTEFRSRLPAAVELLKAMAIAELEIDGRYIPAQDDEFFQSFDSGNLSAADFSLLPDYLVCLYSGRTSGSENAALMELLSSRLPVKVLVQTEEIFEEAAITGGQLAFGVRSAQLANTAVALQDVFVLQSTSSSLYSLSSSAVAGFDYEGTALFSVYSGSAAPAGGLPSYLTSAAALQSRAFPAYVYDPKAGEDFSARYSLAGNPQPDAAWPVENFEFSDDAMQRLSEPVRFTFADFVVCDLRHARHFARVPRACWTPDMVRFDEWLAMEPAERADRVPYLLAVDANDALHRVLVDSRVAQATQRCLEMWHRRQELGGVRNPHLDRMLARSRAAWEEEKRAEIAALTASAGAQAAAPVVADGAAAAAAPAVAATAAPAAPEHSPDEAWIETDRCPSCGECRNINDKMFGYNDNKQAFIADLKAGTFRQLVEAAESCQVAIIHPGKPRDPNEPGLEELIQRAETFA